MSVDYLLHESSVGYAVRTAPSPHIWSPIATNNSTDIQGPAGSGRYRKPPQGSPREVPGSSCLWQNGRGRLFCPLPERRPGPRERERHLRRYNLRPNLPKLQKLIPAIGIASAYLKTVLETNLPKSAKGAVKLGVADKNLASSIKAAFPYIEAETPETSEVTGDLLRGLRLHSQKLLKQLQDGGDCFC
jgi:hypothetical protein